MIPEFPVACRRLTPGPGYLEALCEDNVSAFEPSALGSRKSHRPSLFQVDFISTPIKRFTEKGLELEDGTHHDLDVIFCATGA